MHISRWIFGLIGMIGLAGLLVACGSNGAPSVSASGSGSGSASASGTITNFGSVYVNGKKFDASEVEVFHEDQSIRCSISASNTCGLKKGMVVTVHGSFTGTQHTAASVRQKDAVEGLVQSVATDGLRMVVMGQTVFVDDTTIFDNNVHPVAGDNVEVNGHIRPGGVIQATFIEKKLLNVTPEVRGFVTNHNDGTKTFQIGTLTVSYATALISDMPVPNGSNWNGLLVEAKGIVFNATTLTATKVEPENPGVGNQVDEFEVEGYVTQVRGTGDFLIGSTRVQAAVNTEFRGGTVDEIAVGAKLSTEGRWENGVLLAKHVKFHESVKLEGDIATIGANAFTLTGLSGLTITVNGQTEFKDASLDGLSSGDHVRVRGRVGGANSVIATRVELRSADNNITLQGPVQSIAGNVLVILSVPVDTSTVTQFESVSGSSENRAGFLAEAHENSLVKIKGKLSGSMVRWEEAESED
ncbi:MAG: hypothetical protein JSR29_12130 [Nitrospira sp.]|nr:hypothetical protein [Nitrospira sp.]